MALVAKSLISLIALGARFLKVAPCNFFNLQVSILSFQKPGLPNSWCFLPECSNTYSLVEVDGVLAGDNVGNGRALGLARRLLGFCRHGCAVLGR